MFYDQKYYNPLRSDSLTVTNLGTMYKCTGPIQKIQICRIIPEFGLLRLTSGLEVIKLCSCSTQLSTKFILLINAKMPTFAGILTFISMIHTTSERLKTRTSVVNLVL